MDSMTAIFAPALDKYTRTLLARIAVDYNLNEAELVAKYLGSPLILTKKAPSATSTPRKPKAPKEEKRPCPGLTAKKTPCKYSCAAGENFCNLHSGKPRVPKVKKVLEALAPAPAPAPQLAEESVCEPCNQDSEPEFDSDEEGPEAEMSIQDRLRMIIGEEELDE